ncbi:hypothetical protein [Streptomyces sp. NPDC053427]|uniref:hypothetical protein n=1 Tax=Streptomyces sp. NPDC053427 TaxID=3365701 RepID=UPI0037D4835F
MLRRAGADAEKTVILCPAFTFQGVRMLAIGIFPNGEKFAMTQDYAAVISAALAALFLIGIVEVANSFKSRGEDRDLIRAHHMAEIKESILGFKNGTPLTEDRKEATEKSLKLFKKRMDAMQTLTGVHLAFMAGTLFMLGKALLDVLHWSALKGPSDSPDIAKSSYLVTLFAVFSITAMFALRTAMTNRYRRWSARREIAQELGLGVEEAMALSQRWIGEGNPPF